MADITRRLKEFSTKYGFKGKGPICVALVITERAQDNGLPLDPESLLTRGGGQVRGLGRAPVQRILRRHGIRRVFAKEGGRTSRGSIRNMERYVNFLNQLARDLFFDLNEVENYWVDRVKQFFAASPFRLKLDTSYSLRSVVADLLKQAVKRQKDAPGTYYAGAVLQHLVGAKLQCALGPGVVRHREFEMRIDHRSFTTADAPSGIPGDFLLGDVAIHVTTAPGEAVIDRCRENIEGGLRPILVTTSKQVNVANVLSENMGLANRIDVFDIEQFVALNLYEKGKFIAEGRAHAITDLVNCYNKIVESEETDPSLKIERL